MAATTSPITRAPAPSGVLPLVVEHFTLRRAAALQAALDGEAQRALSAALVRARQHADSADTLWSNGHSANALRLLREAIEVAEEAIGIYAAARAETRPAAAPPSDEAAGETAVEVEGGATPEVAPVSAAEARRAVLGELGATQRELRAVDAALTALDATALPALDSEVSPAHAELFRDVANAHEILQRRLGGAAMTAPQIRVARALRSGTAIVLTLGLVVGAYLATRRPEFTVSASAVWAASPDYEGARAVDGRTDTWWLAPDGQQAWLEVRFTSPHHIENVRLLNTVNAPHNDRGTRDYRIELYGSNGSMIRSVESSFEYTTDPQWVEHAVGLDDVARIRFVVQTFHRTSAGLTELDWD